MSTRRIIVGYDDSAEAKAAAAWALDEAARSGAAVEFVHANEWPAWAPPASTVGAPEVWPDGEIDRAVRGMLDDAVAAARQSHPGVRTEVSVVNAGAAATLIDHSADAGLIVVGSQGHSAVAGLLGSVSAAVSARAHCPVVVVRGTSSPAAPVVAGVDDAPYAASVLAFAAAAAADRGVALHVVRAWPPVGGLWAGTLGDWTVTDQERKPFDDLVQQARAEYPGLDITAEAVVAHPAAVLTRASTTAQLLVVGTRGHGTVTGLLLGSVSQHLLRHAACTVAVVR